MRPIDADALYDNYLETMKELIKSTTYDNVGLQVISLLCGAKLVTDAPTIELIIPQYCPHCGRTVIGGNIKG